MTEAELLQAVRDVAKLRGWLCYHTHDSRRSEPGFPDLIMVHPRTGQFLAIELKSATGRLSADQCRWLGLRFVRQDDDGGRAITEPEHTPPDVVALGRMFTAYLNGDADTAMDLWEAAVRADLVSGVLVLALDMAGELLRARKGGAA